ncbi:pyridoxal phosphate-dependent transferase [Cantharellus anzutake]|uniref:pyridoxal phosphate-dependent transferase n=1 Tax=Cantharellus anzutake TaxID=1750568 RepID=UPI001905E7B2|nr:pyridoxal phosphate-dependent transferase [Cantharellus anzutake]KAF8321976.1 pyridoxal phosphate-dependent transferase [Cantharellus anzutake]
MYDQNVQVNLPGESISTVVEARCLEMLLDLLELPKEAFPGRTITTGATASNIIGLACGREYAMKHAMGDPSYSAAEDGLGSAIITILADRPHASLLKAASLVGIGRSNVLDVSDPQTQAINLGIIEEHLKRSPEGSKRGIIIALSYGEVNTGEFTNGVSKVKALCDIYHAWIHIDAAFGAFARVVPELRHLASHLELADSITSDAHKWLNVPYDAGVFFCRSLELQMAVFGSSPRAAPPAYLTPLSVSNPDNPGWVEPTPDLMAALHIPSPLNIGIENSRRFRALPIFCALMAVGKEGYEGLVRRNVGFARKLAAWMSTGEGGQWYEVLNLTHTPALSEALSGETPTVPLNVVLFRAKGGQSCPAIYDPSKPEGPARLVQAINATRKVYVSPALNAVRMAVSNWMTGLSCSNVDGRDVDIDFEVVVEALSNVMK